MKRTQFVGCVAASAMLFTACGKAPSEPTAMPGLVPDAQVMLPMPADAGQDAVAEDATTPEVNLSSLPRDIAETVCAALFRCCSEEDKEQFFRPIVAVAGLTRFASRVPPAVEMTESSCAETVTEMYEQQPFGSWIAGTEEHGVQFQSAAFEACRAELTTASCGAEVRSAIFDGRCFGWQPPAASGVHRGLFERTATVGAACQPIRDGVGAGYFGTCDPATSFCCYTDVLRPEIGCTYPYTADDEPRQGMCAAASPEGGACSALAPIQLCQSGLTCDSGTQRCVRETEAPLDTGDACVDDRFNLLGICTDGYCDLFGSRECLPYRADGESCIGAEECRSGACASGVCEPLRYCEGEMVAS